MRLSRLHETSVLEKWWFSSPKGDSGINALEFTADVVALRKLQFQGCEVPSCVDIGHWLMQSAEIR
jgi:hypothetical protein